jgi:tryptophanase
MKRHKQPAEPFRIKSVEPIKLLNRHEREQKMIEARYNVFKIDAEDVFVDLLTDSGTSAMSNSQWAALMMGDESYAGARSFRRFEKVVQDVFGKKFVLPCHQGRAAENLLFSTILKKGQYVVSNTLFDTTRANAVHKGGVPVDLPCPELSLDEPRPFKGNMDVGKLEALVKEHGPESIGIVIMTVTNNSVGGQPVSMANVREVSEICHRHGILFYYDCARFAENAYFIKRDEPGFAGKSITDIASEMFTVCDGVMMSSKKDGLANMGGFVALDDRHLYGRLCDLMILIEGFPTYGGLAGRDLEVLAVGLREVMDFDYLDYRVAQVVYLGEKIKEAGMPIVEPTGGHAVFIDAGRLLPHIPPELFPGQSLSVEFYLEGGIRCVEIGSVMFGQTDPTTGKMKPALRELVRMALPRRVYTNSHVDYVADAAARIVSRKESIPGYKILRESKYLRHFTCELAVAKEGAKVGR